VRQLNGQGGGGPLPLEVGELPTLLDSTPIPLKGAGLRTTGPKIPQPRAHKGEGPCTDDLAVSWTPVESHQSLRRTSNDIGEIGRRCPLQGPGFMSFDKATATTTGGIRCHVRGFCFVNDSRVTPVIQPRRRTEPCARSQQPQILGDTCQLSKHRRPGRQTHQRVLTAPRFAK